MSVLLSISVSPSTAQDSLCADLSWELVGPYPYIPDATQTTQFLQLSCFTYQISAVITSPTWTIPWFTNIVPVSDTNMVKWDPSYLWTNPDHDTITSQQRMFWDLTRTTLTTESNYQRMLWRQGEEDLLSNTISHSLVSYQLANPDQVRETAVSISTTAFAASVNRPTETNGSTETVLRKRIPSTVANLLPISRPANLGRERMTDFFRLRNDPEYAKEEFERVLKLHNK